MKILLINKFLYPKGGDAVCTIKTGELLRAKGHEVNFWGMESTDNPPYPYSELFVDNLDLNNAGRAKKQLAIAAKLLYSKEAKKKVEQFIKVVGKPDIVHLHNFAHQISPSILDVFKKYKIPCVMTMHDYKLACAAYTLLSHGKVCKRCSGVKYYQCFKQGCVKGSKAKSLLNTIEMYLHHKILHIYDYIDTFISPSLFLKETLEEMGFKGKVIHIPNFVEIEKFTPRYDWQENTICYMGRLSHEKGVETLIEAMQGLPVTLKIIGDGPLKEQLMVSAAGCGNIAFLGYRSGDDLKNEIRNSMFTVIPSQWYENNPLSVIEAFALGKPVIGARIGGIPELVKDNITGITFTAGDAADLRDKILFMINNPDKLKIFGQNARRFAEAEFSSARHYEKLIKIYNEALGAK